MIITHCNVKQRLPKPPAKGRCAKCKHVFTPFELSKATHEEPPKTQEDGRTLFDLMAQTIGEQPPMTADPTAIGPDLDALSDEELVDKLMGRKKGG